MAKLAEIKIRGKIGNLIIAKRGDTWYVRLATGEIKHAAVTKRYSKNFGMASTVGKQLRQQLLNSIPYPKDLTMQRRLTGVIAKWLYLMKGGDLQAQQSLPHISGFSFNEGSSNARNWIAALSVTQPDAGILQLQVPAFIPVEAFKAPAGTVIIECIITTAYCRLQKPVAATSIASQRFQIAFHNAPVAEQSISLLLPAEAGGLLVTVISICYRDIGGNKITKRAYLPSAVVDARYTGE